MLFGYLKRHIKIIVLLCLFIAMFALVFSLYDLPAEAVLYAAALCLAVGLVLFAVGFRRYVLQHRELHGLRDRITVSIEHLPRPAGALERDYQELLRVLFAEKNRIESTADATMSDMIEYFTMWVHQIKTPIAAMRLMLQAGEDGQSDALAMELFKIEQYVSMVLQYLRVDSGSTDFVLRDCALDDIVRQCVRKYARLFILKKIELDFRESSLVILTDEKWLSFVIEQVLSNSLKYTSSGRISVYAEGLSLVIEDTGIGIKSEDLPRVFEHGFTGYNGRADKKSTGIGLYLCRRIIDRLGHTIAVTSEPGRGTRVKIGLETSKVTGRMNNSEIQPRKNIRLPDYDYSQNGMYFVTICTENRRNLFWDVGAIINHPRTPEKLSDSPTFQNCNIRGRNVSQSDGLTLRPFVILWVSQKISHGGH